MEGVYTKCKTFFFNKDDELNEWLNREMLNGYSFVQSVSSSNGFITVFVVKESDLRGRRHE